MWVKEGFSEGSSTVLRKRVVGKEKKQHFLQRKEGARNSKELQAILVLFLKVLLKYS